MALVLVVVLVVVVVVVVLVVVLVVGEEEQEAEQRLNLQPFLFRPRSSWIVHASTKEMAGGNRSGVLKLGAAV